MWCVWEKEREREREREREKVKKKEKSFEEIKRKWEKAYEHKQVVNKRKRVGMQVERKRSTEFKRKNERKKEKKKEKKKERKKENVKR